MVHKKDNYSKGNTGYSKGDAGSDEKNSGKGKGQNKPGNENDQNNSEDGHNCQSENDSKKKIWTEDSFPGDSVAFSRSMSRSRTGQSDSPVMGEPIVLNQENVDELINYMKNELSPDEQHHEEEKIRGDFKQWLHENFVFSEEDDPYKTAIDNASDDFSYKSGNYIVSWLNEVIEGKHCELKVLIPDPDVMEQYAGDDCRTLKEEEEMDDGLIRTLWWEFE